METKDNTKQIQLAIVIQNLLVAAGYPTLAAGGFVRDCLLKRPFNDIDLATHALPQEGIKVLNKAGISTYESGPRHGTITAVIEGLNFEITTLRVDRKCDGRHAEVEFIKSFEEDAKRRDFTINALFMDLNDKQVYDYVGGIKDLEDKKLRFVGDPTDRIREDFLRILRLFRFQSQLGFGVQGSTFTAAMGMLPYLTYISPERIRVEFLKMIIGDHIGKIDQKVITQVIPELIPCINFKQNCKYHIYDVYCHIMTGLSNITYHKDPITSFAFLLHDIAKPYCHTNDNMDHFYGHEEESERIADYVCDRLRFSSNDKKLIKFLIKHHMELYNNKTPKAYRRLVNKCLELNGCKDTIEKMTRMYEADYRAMNNDYLHEFFDISDGIFEATAKITDPKHTIKSPLDGIEIKLEFKIEEGKDIGKIKDYLKQLVIDGELAPGDKDGAKKKVREHLGL